MRRLHASDYVTTSWRNGGGTTTQIVIEPPSAELAGGARFLYRVSIADVAADGPFSRFDGYDRHIMMLSGSGIALDCGDRGRIEIGTAFAPCSFSGDWEVDGRLVDGPIRDLNLIVDRARATSSLEALLLDDPTTIPVPPGEQCVVHVLSGELDGAAENDTLVLRDTLELVPRTRSRVALARVSRRKWP